MEQKGVRQTVEAVSADTLRIIGIRNRQAPGNVRKIGMERRVETDKLGHVGPDAPCGLDQVDFVRQMIRRKTHEPPECGDQFVGDELRMKERRPAVNDAMTDSGQWIRDKTIDDAL